MLSAYLMIIIPVALPCSVKIVTNYALAILGFPTCCLLDSKTSGVLQDFCTHHFRSYFSLKLLSRRKSIGIVYIMYCHYILARFPCRTD